MKTKGFSELSSLERDELLVLPESRWTDCKPMYWHDYCRIEAKKQIANKLLQYVFAGLDDGAGSVMCSRIMETMTCKEDRMALAELLIDGDTYYDYQPDYANLGQDSELEEQLRNVKEQYKGIDAYVEAARLEFAENLAQEYADVEDLINLFKK